MNIRHTFYIGLAIVLIAAASVAVYRLQDRQIVSDHLIPPLVPPAQAPVANLPITPPPATIPTAEPVVNGGYENPYMKVAVPAGWKLEELTEFVPEHMSNSTTSLQVDDAPPIGVSAPVKTGAVTITKGNYILYIHPHASQASGVTGGRFAEIAMGSPSANAVVTEQPSPPCGQTVSSGTIRIPGLVLTRKDLYVSSADKKDYCAVPAKGTAWYFSYVTDPKGGYINYYKAGELPGYVITMAYNAAKPDLLPLKGSAELEQALADMTGIVKTLELKNFKK